MNRQSKGFRSKINGSTHNKIRTDYSWALEQYVVSRYDYRKSFRPKVQKTYTGSVSSGVAEGVGAVELFGVCSVRQPSRLGPSLSLSKTSIGSWFTPRLFDAVDDFVELIRDSEDGPDFEIVGVFWEVTGGPGTVRFREGLLLLPRRGAERVGGFSRSWGVTGGCGDGVSGDGVTATSFEAESLSSDAEFEPSRKVFRRGEAGSDRDSFSSPDKLRYWLTESFIAWRNETCSFFGDFGDWTSFCVSPFICLEYKS